MFDALDHLKEVLEKDRSLDLSNDQSLASLPDHYIEISRLLLENCEDDIADAHEVRSVIDAIVKVRENRLNEFRGTVVDYLSQSLVRKFNQGDTQEFVRRSFYDVPFLARLVIRLLEVCLHWRLSVSLPISSQC